MIVEDHDMSDLFFAFGDLSRRDHEDSLLSSRRDIRQPVGSNHHHSFLKRSKIDISQNMKPLWHALKPGTCITASQRVLQTEVATGRTGD
jgi:hypothetical protein